MRYYYQGKKHVSKWEKKQSRKSGTQKAWQSVISSKTLSETLFSRITMERKINSIFLQKRNVNIKHERKKEVNEEGRKEQTNEKCNYEMNK